MLDKSTQNKIHNIINDNDSAYALMLCEEENKELAILKIQDLKKGLTQDEKISVYKNLEIIVKADTKLAGSGEMYAEKRRTELYHAWENSTSYLNFVTKLHMASF